jgi:hypothetical protein
MTATESSKAQRESESRRFSEKQNKEVINSLRVELSAIYKTISGKTFFDFD